MNSISDILKASLGNLSVNRVLSALATLLICLVAVRLILKIAGKLLRHIQKVNERLQKIILTAIKVVLYTLTAIITAEALGINTTSLTALLSVLTLGVTLAAEDILGNMAGGLVILSSHPFALGDFIEAGGVSGTVREINLNHTKLETADGQTVLIPNRELSSSKIINYSTLGRRRIVRTISASYRTPVETAKAACMAAIRATDFLLDEPAPAVRLTNYGTSSVEYTVYCWADLDHYWDASFRLNELLLDAFAKHGVEMTYDHLNVHISQTGSGKPL